MNGSVTRRKRKGDWEYRFEAGRDPLTGRRMRLSKAGFATKREAVQAMRKAILEHEKGRSVRPSGTSVAEFMGTWHESVKASVRPTTWVNYRNYIRAYVVPTIGTTRLQDLTPLRLNLLYGHLLEHGRVRGPGGLAPKTVVNVHRMMHRALRDAMQWDLVPRNAAEGATGPRVPHAKRLVWTPEQLRAFLTHVREDRFYALWLLVVTTGLRRGELAGLLRRDVDFAYGRITPSVPRVVVDGIVHESENKTRSGARSLALDPETLGALETYVADWDRERQILGQDTQLLFVWSHGRPLHPDTITELFHKHCEAAGLPRIRLHDVRHSYATAALMAGISPKIVSERLGHSTAAFTLQVYSHVIPGMDAVAANTVADLILGAKDRSANRDGRQNGRHGPSDDLLNDADLGESPGQRW